MTSTAKRSVMVYEDPHATDERHAAAEPVPHGAPVRALVFRELPRALLLHFPEGAESVKLPEISLPICETGVRAAFRRAGIEVRVSESVPGRWVTALQQARNAERAERTQLANLAKATSAALMRQSPSLLVQQRGEAMRRKEVVDEEVRRLKVQIGEAKSRAFTRGVYMDPVKFRAMEQKLEELKQESQALQVRMTELRKREKAENVERSRREQEARTATFVEAAKRVLDADTYREIWDEVEAMTAEAEDCDSEVAQ